MELRFSNPSGLKLPQGHATPSCCLQLGEFYRAAEIGGTRIYPIDAC